MAVEPGSRRRTHEWMQEVYARQPEREALFDTISGLPVKPLYTGEDLADWDAERDLGFPGEHPYTRGVYPSMYRGRLWTMRQFAGFGTAEETGVPPEALGGTIQTDILKEYIAQKEWCFPIEPAMRLVADMIEWCAERMPRWHPISISGYHIREAGSTAQQELAFTLKDGFTYVEQALERGLSVDEFAPRLSFFFNAHIDFFEEIAKYRAARRIEEAVRIALRTQQVIAHETGVTNTIDPLGGSYFVEKLTDEMERAAYEYFARIDELGGMVEAIRESFPQREIAEASFRYQQEVRDRKRIVVGVNEYELEDEEQIPILRIDPALERKQIGRLETSRARRDSAAVETALAELKEAAASDRNLMPYFIDAARARASEGEMIAALQAGFG